MSIFGFFGLGAKDPFVTALKSSGYNTVRLPKADVKPMQLLTKSGSDLDRLGDVTQLLLPGGNIQPPGISFDNPTADLSGIRTSDLKTGVGLNILGTIIKAMGGNLGVEAQYQNARNATFEFHDVLSDSIQIIQLDQYLGDADIHPAGVFIPQLLEADKLYVITSTIKSKKFSFEAKKSDGTSLAVDIPIIQQAVGGSLKVSGSTSTTTKATFEGADPLVFGFQAVQIVYDDGQFTSLKILKPGDGAMRGITEAQNAEPDFLTTEGSVAL